MALTITQARQAEKHRKYWQQREEEALEHYIKDEKEYDKQIQEIYQNMLDSCQKEIDAFYGKYAKKEGITIAEAKKKVSEVDIKAYEAKAKKYVKQASLDRRANAGETDFTSSAFSERANEEMRLYNLTMKVNRLEMLKANIGLETIKGHAELENFMDKILQGRTKEELERQAGILGKTIRSNSKKAHAIPNASFHNATFSDRIWQYHDLMKADLSKLLQQGLIRGKSSRELAKDLRKYFKGEDGKGGAQFNTERLMRTELARVQIEAQKQSLIENGFTEYMFIVNSGCCPICYGIAKKNDGIYKIDKMQPGLNAPPIHPFCRCSIAAHEDDAEYEAWLDYLDKGGTTEEWNKMSSKRKGSLIDAMNLQLKKEAEVEKKTSKSDSEVLENSDNDSTIELQADINKMITPYEKKVLDAVPKKEGFFDFAAHGTADNIEYGSEDKVLTAREVARIIRHNESYNGEKVRLLSCNTGSVEDGFAQQLANALGVEVEAPSDVLLVYPDGRIQIGYDAKGKMITFKPKGRGK